MSTFELKQFILETAQNLGFSKIGIAPAKPETLTENKLHSWLGNNYHATMTWMEKRSSERGNIQTYNRRFINRQFNFFSYNEKEGAGQIQVNISCGFYQSEKRGAH